MTISGPGPPKVRFSGLRVESDRISSKTGQISSKTGQFRGLGASLGWPLGTPKCVPVFSHTARSPEGEGISKSTLFRVGLARFLGK